MSVAGACTQLVYYMLTRKFHGHEREGKTSPHVRDILSGISAISARCFVNLTYFVNFDTFRPMREFRLMRCQAEQRLGSPQFAAVWLRTLG